MSLNCSCNIAWNFGREWRYTLCTSEISEVSAENSIGPTSFSPDWLQYAIIGLYAISSFVLCSCGQFVKALMAVTPMVNESPVKGEPGLELQ
jgi:hypothetical protein